VGRASVLTFVGSVMLAGLVGLATVRLGSFQHQLKAVLIVVAGLAMAFGALRPQVGLLLVLALNPFKIGFYGTNSVQALLLALALVLAWRIDLRSAPSWVLVGTIALVGGSFLASIGAQNKSLAAEQAVNWLAAAVVMLAAFSVLRRRADASRLGIEVFMAGAVIVVMFGFMQKAGIHPIVGPPYDGTHPNSFFGYYTVYAGFIAIAAILATGELLIALAARERVRAAVFAATLLFMVAGLAATTSRGGIVALGTGWIMLLLFNLRRGTILARAIICLSVMAAIGYAVIPHATIVTLQHRFATSNGALSEDQTRFAVQAAGEHALRESPFGLGYGNFQYYIRGNVHSGHIRQVFFHAHETFVQIGLDSGWLGLAGFLILLVTPLVVTFKHSAGGASAVRASAFSAAIAGFMVQGLYDYLFYELSFLIIIPFLVWGASHSLKVDAGEERTSPAAAFRGLRPGRLTA
jgi:hypothetical protein